MGSLVETTTGFSPHGVPGFDRRLTDKILAAFNHAYAAGGTDVASQLHAALALAAERERRLHRSASSAERRGADAVAPAGPRGVYTEERHSYQAICRADGSGTAEDKAALEARKDAPGTHTT